MNPLIWRVLMCVYVCRGMILTASYFFDSSAALGLVLSSTVLLTERVVPVSSLIWKEK